MARQTVKPQSVALSTTEAEYLYLSEGTKMIWWLRHLLFKLDSTHRAATAVKEDNKVDVIWGHEGVRQAKYVAIRKNFVKENVQIGNVRQQYFATDAMTADILTKPHHRLLLGRNRQALGVLACY